MAAIRFHRVMLISVGFQHCIRGNGGEVRVTPNSLHGFTLMAAIPARPHIYWSVRELHVILSEGLNVLFPAMASLEGGFAGLILGPFARQKLCDAL